MQDLNDIYLFNAVVTHKGFSAAGRALRIPKSHLSKRIARLEEQLGVRLLERSTRTIRITDVGQAFFEKCQAILDGVEAAETVVAETLSEPRGVVRIACPPALARTVLAHNLPGFADRYPAVRVLVSTLNRPVDLIEERIDVAFRARSNLESDPDLFMRVLSRGDNVLTASPQFVAEHEPITIANLSELPTLSPSDTEPDIWRLLGPDDQTAEIQIQPRIVCNDFEVMMSAARAGLGVALLPEYVVEEALRSGSLMRVLPEWATPKVTVHLVFTSRRGMTPAVRAFIDYVATEGSNGLLSQRG